MVTVRNAAKPLEVEEGELVDDSDDEGALVIDESEGKKKLLFRTYNTLYTCTVRNRHLFLFGTIIVHLHVMFLSSSHMPCRFMSCCAYK